MGSSSSASPFCRVSMSRISNELGGTRSKEEVHSEPAVLCRPLLNESGEALEAEPVGAVMVPVLGRPHCKSCKKRHRPALRRGERQEWCEMIGGTIGGILGSPGGWAAVRRVLWQEAQSVKGSVKNEPARLGDSRLKKAGTKAFPTATETGHAVRWNNSRTCCTRSA